MENFVNYNLDLLSQQQKERVFSYEFPLSLTHQLKDIKAQFKGKLNDRSQIAALFTFIYQKSVKTQSKYFLNQLYANSHPLAFLGDLLATHLNTSPYTYEVAPLFSIMERDLQETLIDLFKLSLTSDFITTPGASYGNLMGHYLARELKKIEIGNDFSKDVILYTPLSHYSIQHSTKILGFSKNQLVQIPMTSDCQVDPIELKSLIETLKKDGFKIKLIHLTAGTTVYGSFDPITSFLGDACIHDAWVHVDAALGGSMIFDTESNLLNGINHVDSFIWNLHKLPGGSSAPLQSSLLIVKNGLHLKEVNSLQSDYLYAPDKYYPSEYDMGDKYAQCGRKNDILKAWLLLTFCQDEIRNALKQMIDSVNYLKHHFRDNLQLHVRSYSPLVLIFWYIPKKLRGNSIEYNLKFEKETLTEYTNEIKRILIQEMNDPIMIAIQDGLEPGTPEKFPKFFRLLPSNTDLNVEDQNRIFKVILEIGERIDQIKLKS